MSTFGSYRRTQSWRSGQNTATVTLIGLNVAVWLLLQVTGGGSSPFLTRLALMPVGRCVPVGEPGSYFPGADRAQCLTQAGMNWIPGVADGAFWQLATTMFTHLEPLHIGFNMLALWFLGPQLEQMLGRGRFVVIYLISGLTGSSLVYWLSSPGSITLGASGAIFGLMGTILVVALKLRGDVNQILIWLGINAAITFLGGSYISWQGHLGGFIGGVAVAALIAYTPRRDSHYAAIGMTSWTFLLLVADAARTLALRGSL